MFKTFPEFSKLTFDDKNAYEALIKDYPPIGDLSFAGLMTWWDFGHTAISTLNGNIVLPYWLPGDEKNSGLSLIGTNEVDESICAIFDHLRNKGEPPKLINVPEFVIGNVAYPEMYIFKEQRNYHEYLVTNIDYYPIERMPRIWRERVKKKLAKINERTLEVAQLDLNQPKNKYQLLTALAEWRSKSINDYGQHEQDACTNAIVESEKLGIENMCLFVEGRLYGFCLFCRPNSELALVYHVKATSKHTLGFSLMLYAFAKWLTEHGVKTTNLSADCGILKLRMFMLTLGPTNFYRKYSIEPA